MIHIRLRHLAPLLVVVALAGCGDDDDDSGTTSTGPATTPTEVETTPTETETAPAETETETVPEEEVEPPPEEQPGGAGDEVPAQSPAGFTGRGGRVTPRTVRVPPFIAIRIQLTSADGADYGLNCGGRRLSVDADIASASTRIAGRRPGERVRCAPLGDHNGVVISASAEPGP